MFFFQFLSEQGSSPAGEHADRRHSIASNAPSEASHVDRAGKDGGEPSVQSYVITQQAKNYFKSISENKEITKLVSLLSTSINSNKKVSSTSCLHINSQ